MKNNNLQDNEQIRDRVYIISPNIFNDKNNYREADAILEEAKGLALAINLDVVKAEIINLKSVNSGSFLGSGKIKEIAEYIEAEEIDLVVFDYSLSPVQQRNLEKTFNCKVIDRTALILEIFGERASTREGVLQVELAHLTYQKSRLVRSWTHLERQRGGMGFVGGPGETQIELDRRLITDRITKLKKELENVKKTRFLHRKSRKKTPFPIVALVGYTNAGKSTLFNKLCGSDVFAKDLLFATLDPTMRKIELPNNKSVILSDTVGFISNLPTELIAAFRATLEEVLEADIIVHVRDISHNDTIIQKDDVNKILCDLGLEEKINKGDIIEVYNKIDLLSEEEVSYLSENTKNNDNLILMSAVTGYGVDDFCKIIDKRLSDGSKEITIKVKSSNGKLIDWLYKNSKVINSVIKKDDILYTIFINDENLNKLEKMLD